MQLEFIVVSTQQQRDQAFYVRREVFIEEQQVPEELELDEFDSIATHFLVLNNGEAIGAARIRPYHPDGTAKVERVAVRKSVRGKGIGAVLMKQIEAYAEEKGFKELKLNSQIQAEDFYQRLGYFSYGDYFMDANIEHISMMKKLV